MMFEERIYIERREKLKKQFQTGNCFFSGMMNAVSIMLIIPITTVR
jgi:hypothetical protein